MQLSRPYKFIPYGYHQAFMSKAFIGNQSAACKTHVPGRSDCVSCRQFPDLSIKCYDKNNKVIGSKAGGTTSAVSAPKATASAKLTPGASGSAKVDPNKFNYGKNKVSGCGNCKPGDVLCEIGKLGCEGQAAILGTSNAVQTGVRDSVLGSSNALQDAVLGQSDAVQKTLGGWYEQLADWAADAGWNIQQGSGNTLMPILIIGGVIIVAIVLLKR